MTIDRNRQHPRYPWALAVCAALAIFATVSSTLPMYRDPITGELDIEGQELAFFIDIVVVSLITWAVFYGIALVAAWTYRRLT